MEGTFIKAEKWEAFQDIPPLIVPFLKLPNEDLKKGESQHVLNEESIKIKSIGMDTFAKERLAWVI